MIKPITLACGTALLTATAAFGQVVQETQTTTTPAGTTQTWRVSQILGSTVRLQGNNNYGKVDDIVLDQNGNFAYLVVANGNQYAMMPWVPANYNYAQRYVTYNVTPQAVQPLLFAQNAWPNIADPRFMTRTRTVFPSAAPVRREVLRPVPGAAPAPGAVVPAPGTVAPAPPGAVIQEKIKEKPNGTIKVKEQVK